MYLRSPSTSVLYKQLRLLSFIPLGLCEILSSNILMGRPLFRIIGWATTMSTIWSVFFRALFFPSFLIPYSQIGAVLQNFSDAVVAAQNLDLRLAAAGQAISGNYSDLLSISTRQAFGAFDLTVSLSDNNKVNTSDVKAFARNFGSLGSGGYVFSSCLCHHYCLMLIIRQNQCTWCYICRDACIHLLVARPSSHASSSITRISGFAVIHQRVRCPGYRYVTVRKIFEICNLKLS